MHPGSVRGRSRAWLGWATACLAVLALASCGQGSSAASSGAHTPGPRATTAPTTTTTTPAAVSDLSASGFSPGVDQSPFYPTVTINSVSCGPSPTGGFVEVQLPAGGAGTTPGSALTEATTTVVVAGRAEVKDHTGKVLYADAEPTIVVAPQGVLALSMPNVTEVGGDQRPVEIGAVNLSGNYTCPALSVLFPGL